ncbi:MAG: diaminopimelate decarboxylase [Pseudomonadota bacterium]|nr:diaminopimelate decarboxylase [Pseudomonadota bacterium]
MNYFDYKNGKLNVEFLPISEIEKEVGTPFYCYSVSSIVDQFRAFSSAVNTISNTICYAVKANSNLAVIRTLAILGAGADVVSEGELVRALKSGISANKIVFSGVGKTESELRLALDKKILQINIESESELERINNVARSKGVVAPVALRVNPNVDAKSHDKISTGRKGDKFGVEWENINRLYSLASELPYVEPVGLAMHIGSQLTTLSPFKAAFTKLKHSTIKLRERGFNVKRLDLGGGLGIAYDPKTQLPSPADYGELLIDIFEKIGCEIILEPGRLLVGNSGILVTKIIDVKSSGTQNFVIVDAAMNDLMRPSLYDAEHMIIPIVENKDKKGNSDLIDIVGPVCESADKFASRLSFSPLQVGDLLAICSAGAYGAVMASTYNSRPLIPEVLVKGDQYSVIRKRVNTEEMLNYERMPDWLS